MQKIGCSLIALTVARNGPGMGGGRTERLRQVQMEHRPGERAALTAPDRIKLASGGELAALPSTGITLALRPPADARLPTPPERAPKEGTFAGFASFKSAPKGRNLHRQPVGGRLGRLWCRTGIS